MLLMSVSIIGFLINKLKRWEVKHSDYIAANTNRKHYMWLIDLKWWKKWEKSLEKNSDRDKSDPKNEVILSLKNLGKDNSDKSNGEIEKMDNSSLFKSVSSTHKFVFDERGHIPKTELGFGNCKPVSEYTFDYLKSRYGPCLSKFTKLQNIVINSFCSSNMPTGNKWCG